MKMELQFRENGRIAELIHPNGLTIARLLVHGPMERNAKSVAKQFDDCFYGEIRGIGDNQFIDEKSLTIKTTE